MSLPIEIASPRSIYPSLMAPGAILLLLPLAIVRSEVVVSTEFPGGSGEVRMIGTAQRTSDPAEQTSNPAEQMIHIHPTVHRDRGWPCWWYVRLDGLQPGERVSFQVSANPQEFSAGQVLARQWSQPDRAAISLDNLHWSQTPPHRKLAGGVVQYQFVASASTVWLAWGPPFLPSDSDELLSRIALQTPTAERFVLATTRQGREVPAIRLTESSSPNGKRKAIWVQARQHAWESGSSWVGRGLIQWAASNDPAAISLRRTTDVYFVPIMDVDNVVAGAGGKNARPRDHNRDWTATPHYPEVAAAQKKLLELNQDARLAVFIDLHNPGSGHKQPYFYGPPNLTEMPADQQQAYARLLAATAAAMSGPLELHPRYRFATYIKTDEERARVSRNWVDDHTDSHVIALTLETAWNTPHSTTSGYQTVGRQLGEALASYLAPPPSS